MHGYRPKLTGKSWNIALALGRCLSWSWSWPASGLSLSPTFYMVPSRGPRQGRALLITHPSRRRSLTRLQHPSMFLYLTHEMTMSSEYAEAWKVCLTREQLKVWEGLGEDPPALLFHGQWDHQQSIRQLGKVLDKVVLPVGQSKEISEQKKGAPQQWIKEAGC